MKGVPKINGKRGQRQRPVGRPTNDARTGSDTIAVERRLLGQLLAFAPGLLLELLSLLGGPKAPAPLLVHLCPGRNAVDGHKKDLARLDLREEVVDVGKDGEDHLLLRQPERGIALG